MLATEELSPCQPLTVISCLTDPTLLHIRQQEQAQAMLEMEGLSPSLLLMVISR